MRYWFQVTIAIFVCSASLAFACSCAEPNAKSMRELAQKRSEQKGIELIFEGTVDRQNLKSVSGKASATQRLVTVRVAHVYRGSAGAVLDLVTGISESDCGFHFEDGKTYLIYAGVQPDGMPFTDICTGTLLVDEAGPALRFLKNEKALADDLLEPAKYYEKYLPLWTATVCGVVLHPDGTPVAQAIVEMSQVRDSQFPPRVFSDEDLSKADGAFCIKYAEPGTYLLSAQDAHVEEGYRYMGFYPGVTRSAEAAKVKVNAGESLSDLRFTMQMESLYLLRVCVATPFGDMLSPKAGLTVSVSADRDRLHEYLPHQAGEDGCYRFTGMPAGKYSITSHFEPDYEKGRLSPEALYWLAPKKEVDIVGNTQVIMELSPRNSSDKP